MMEMVLPEKIIFLHKETWFFYFFMNKDTGVGWIIDENEEGDLEMRISLKKGDTFIFKGKKT